LTPLVGRQKGHLGVGFVGGDILTGALYRLIAPVVATSSITISSNKIWNGDILVPTNPGPPGKWPLKWRATATLHCLYNTKQKLKMSDFNYR